MIPLEVWLVLSVQVVLGFADVVVHHELIARLPWRSGAAPELRLHAARNLAYAVIFLTLAWILPLGWTAWILAALLLAEATITFIDWIVEDSSRPLPASERALHGLLAINFGVLLALLAPSSGNGRVSRPPLSSSFAASGRGWQRRPLPGCWQWRSETRSHPDGWTDSKRRHCPWIWFVGRRLTEALADGGHEVTVLTRDVNRAPLLGAPFRVVTSLDQIDSTERLDVIVHLAGEPVAGGPWTPARRQRIERSR